LFLSLIGENQYETNEHISNKILPFYLQYLTLIERKDLVNLLITSFNELNKPNSHDVEMKLETSVSYNNYSSFIFALGTFLQLFELNVGEDINKIILFFKDINKRIFKNKGTESKLLKTYITEFLKKRDYTYSFIQKYLTEECHYAIQDLSKSHSYFL